jgi:hypothetical protein
MNTVEIEKILKKAFKRFYPSVHAKIDGVTVFKQSNGAKKPKWCVLVQTKNGKDDVDEIFHVISAKKNEVKDLRHVVTTVFKDTVKTLLCGNEADKPKYADVMEVLESTTRALSRKIKRKYK